MVMLKETNQKIEKAVVDGYKNIETSVVSGYQKMEDGIVIGVVGIGMLLSLIPIYKGLK